MWSLVSYVLGLREWFLRHVVGREECRGGVGPQRQYHRLQTLNIQIARETLLALSSTCLLVYTKMIIYNLGIYIEEWNRGCIPRQSNPPHRVTLPRVEEVSILEKFVR